MVRTQIQLTEEQADRLRQVAAERRLSVAAVIREAVDRALQDDERARKWERALSVVGKFRDREGKTDVAEEHDRYFVEAYFDR